MRYYEVHDEEATLLTEDGKMLVSVFSSEQDLGDGWQEGFDYTCYLIQEDGALSEVDGGFYTGYWHLSKFVDDVCSGLEHTRLISRIAGAVDTMEDLAALLHEDGLPEGVGTDDVKGFIMSMRDRFTAGPLHGDQLVFDCSARELMAAGFTADMLEGRPDRAIITPDMARALLRHEESWGDYCKGTFLLQEEGKYVCIDNFNGLALKESFKTLAAANLWLESGDLEQAMDIDRPSPRAAEPEGIDAIAQAAGEASACLANETESLDGRVERAMGELLPGKISELKEEAAADIYSGYGFLAQAGDLSERGRALISEATRWDLEKAALYRTGGFPDGGSRTTDVLHEAYVVSALLSEFGPHSELLDRYGAAMSEIEGRSEGPEQAEGIDSILEQAQLAATAEIVSDPDPSLNSTDEKER